MAAVRDAGHEMYVLGIINLTSQPHSNPTSSGLHGYSHENPMSMTVEQQKDILDHTYDLLTKFNNGIPPKGSVAPWWETSKEGTMLLLEKGIQYGVYCVVQCDLHVLFSYHASLFRPLQHGTRVSIPSSGVDIGLCLPLGQFAGILPA